MKALSLAVLFFIAVTYFGNASTAVADEATTRVAVVDSSKEVPVGEVEVLKSEVRIRR